MATQQPTSAAHNASPKITPDDPRYLAVVEKRFNKRFSASPDLTADRASSSRPSRARAAAKWKCASG